MADDLKGLGHDEWFSESGQDEFWVSGIEDVNWAERRTDQRSPAVVRVRVDPGGRMATSGDISIGGMLVNTHVPLSQGHQVELMIESPLGSLGARGLVRWVSKSQVADETHGRLCMGIQFTWLSLGMGKLLR